MCTWRTSRPAAGRNVLAAVPQTAIELEGGPREVYRGGSAHHKLSLLLLLLLLLPSQPQPRDTTRRHETARQCEGSENAVKCHGKAVKGSDKGNVIRIAPGLGPLVRPGRGARFGRARRGGLVGSTGAAELVDPTVPLDQKPARPARTRM